MTVAKEGSRRVIPKSDDGQSKVTASKEGGGWGRKQ